MMNRFAFILLITFSTCYFSGCRDKDQSCNKTANLIYVNASDECKFLVLTDNTLYEPINLDEFQFSLLYNDSQKVKITFERNFDIPNCGGIDKITLFCLSEL